MAKLPTLSKSARALLEAAAARDDGFAFAPDQLPVAARRAVVLFLLKSGLIEEVTAEDDQPAWRAADDGARLGLRITEAGLHAIGVVPVTVPMANPPAKVQEPQITAFATPTRPALHDAAESVLSAWDDPEDGRPALDGAIAHLRAALARGPKSQATSSGPRQPRPDTKRATVLALLRRPEGATVAQVVDATGWARHTVHGFFAGLKKVGTMIAVLERVRQVGAGQGAKGSYTVYRAGEAG